MRAEPTATASYWLKPMVCTAVGLVGNALLTVGKILVGLAAHSTALVADGFHSLADVASDIGIVLALKASARPADDNHPYGHHSFETLGAIGVAGLMLLTAALIGKGAVVRLVTGAFLHPQTPALWMSLISVVLKEAMARYTIHAGRLHNSPALLSNGAMHRSDAISSLAAAGGILGAKLGVRALDSVGALIIALLILRMGWQLLAANIMALMDTMPDSALVEGMQRAVATVPGAREVRDLRVRQRGSTYVVDLRLAVDPQLTVAHAHEIAHEVEECLIQRFPEVTRAFVHVEPGRPADPNGA